MMLRERSLRYSKPVYLGSRSHQSAHYPCKSGWNINHHSAVGWSGWIDGCCLAPEETLAL